MQIRAATAEDLEVVGRVHALNRNTAYAGLVPAEALARVTPSSQAQAWLRRWAERPGRSALLVATYDGQVVGFTYGTGAEDPAELHAMHVLPERQGDGTGQALHDALLDRFASWGCTRAELWVLRGNERAQSFYRRNGWMHDGETGSHDVGGAVVPILRYRRPVTSATTRR